MAMHQVTCTIHSYIDDTCFSPTHLWKGRCNHFYITSLTCDLRRHCRLRHGTSAELKYQIMSKKMSRGLNGEDFGQRRPPLHEMIRNILREYPSGQIFKVSEYILTKLFL